MSKPLAIALAALPALLHAQAPSVSARIDPPRIRIGEQARIELTAQAGGAAVQWPVLGDTLSAHVEVVAYAPPDSAADGALTRRITVTSFDTGYWAIPPFRLSVGGRPAESEPLLLGVDAFPVGEAAAPADIKPIQRLPFSLPWWVRRHWAWFAVAGLAAALALGAVALARRLRNRPAPQAPAPPALPLHQRVLEQIDALERERLWQQGRHKAYQSRLTDLLRAYIEERYQVPALERTTDELLHELRVSPLPGEQQAMLANMLRAADLVKFAKALPSPQENEAIIASARRFIRETAPMPEPHAQA